MELCIWYNWSVWGNCDVTCGSGTRTKTRTCSVADSCTGDAIQTESCSNGICPVNGMWGNWTPWSACSPTCGDSGGSQTRSRSCDNPAPSTDGKDCVGLVSDTQSCRHKPNVHTPVCK
ncbi:thrombospondin-1-like [Ruditapes philippinarum]|uniref:thrombospondin-1-like n=1 Tax=Ruditapes philippinarum TaxID=129788 RepID=UPI00295B176A|nr:thrombospondin-1-like [Ruditapes philippinarum]